MDLKSLCTDRTLSMKASMIRELVEMTKGVPGLISFAGGFPSPLTFPKEELAELFKKVILDSGDDILQYGSSGGDIELKNAITAIEDIPLDPDEIHICNGSTNGIFYALCSFIEPGDYIITESPSFLGSLVSFEACGAKLIPVSMDAEGIKTDELDSKIAAVRKANGRIKFIYTIPDFQNPTGITMSRQRREKLIELALANKLIVLEDDPYSKIRFKGKSEESLFTIARKKYQNCSHIVSVRSFSKLLGPGLRIAYTLADKKIISYMNSWSQKINVTTDRVTQRVVAQYLTEGLLPSQIDKIISIYSPLWDTMINSLEKNMPDSVSWTQPEGGMFIWLTLAEDQKADLLFPKALEKKVAYIPGSKFYPSGHEEQNVLRLNFSFSNEKQIEEGVQRLAEILSSR